MSGSLRLIEKEVLECVFQITPSLTYPQLTQAIVPWPFTVWATSESSFRWESPDVATDTE